MNDWEKYEIWLGNNDWYTKNDEMREWADEWGDEHWDISYSDKLRYATESVKMKFPEYFCKPKSIMPCGGQVEDCRCKPVRFL